jgi:serpin B
MKNFFKILWSIVALVILGSCGSDKIGETDEPATPQEEEPTVVLTQEIETRAIEQVNNFSYNLFAAINNDLSSLDEKNIFISPLSVSMALSMTANGASGETREEIIKALGYDGVTTIDVINQVNAKLLATLPSVDPEVKLTIANALWIDNDFTIKAAFGDKLKETYQATIDNLDFSDSKSVNVINDWANFNTKGLIPKVVEKIDPSTDIILANALYFKGDWSSVEFIDYGQGNFTNYDGNKTEVNRMLELDSLQYNSNDKCAITTISLGNGSYTYTAVLPNDKVTVGDAVASLTDDYLNGTTKQLVSFLSPKFDIVNKLSLNDYLQSLGIKSIFSSSADFSNITDGSLFINQIRHDSSISVSEKGIEAAAITSEAMSTSNGVKREFKKFFLDKPFAFIIRETSTNAIVFIGAVNQL